MKTRLFFILIVSLLGMGTRTFGQDIIITHEADEIEAKVLQIDENQIIYQKADESVKRTIGKDKVLAIKYANGTKEVFKKTEARTSVPVSVAPAIGNAALQEALNFPTDYSDLPRASRPYSLLDYYNENGIEGIVIEVADGGYHGKIIALDWAENGYWPYPWTYKYNWADRYYYWKRPIGSTDLYNGEKNTQIIRKFVATSSSVRKNKWKVLESINKIGTGWYIPAYGEVLRFFHVFCPYPGYFDKDDMSVLFNQLNAVFTSHGGKPIKWGESVLGSSTEVPCEDGFILTSVYFNGDMFNYDLYHVRRGGGGIRAFHRF